MENLINQQAVFNLIGNKTIFKFVCLVDGIAEFKNVVPKVINEGYYTFRLSIFVDDNTVILDYDEAQSLSDEKVFELWAEELGGDKECLYHKKYDQL